MAVNASATAPAPPPRQVYRRPTVLGVRAGQIVAAQVALALLIAAAGKGVFPLAGATIAAAALVAVAWLRVRRRWLFQWLAIGVRYSSRRRTLPAQARPQTLLDLVRPGAEVVPAELDREPAALISDGYGLTAVIELGDPSALLADTVVMLPSPDALLPPPAPDLPQARVQVLITGVPAPTPCAGSGAVATSYRQLTEGRLLSQQRAVLAVRVPYAEGWAQADLRRSLSSLVRKVRRRLGQMHSRPLGEAAALAVLADLAHHDGVAPVRETWHAVHLGGLSQATFRLDRWPDLRTETVRTLVPRLLALPAAATTVSISADASRTGAEMVVRVSAPDATGLASACQALHRLLSAEGARAQRLDGEQMDGFAATLPLGGSLPHPAQAPAQPAGDVSQLRLSLGGDGLMIGSDRHGKPVTLRVFRPEATRLVLVGGISAAQLLALRAMALGARVAVRTSRPHVWEPFMRGVSTPGEAVVLLPSNRQAALAPGTPMRPLLLVVDVGPVGLEAGNAWQATLVVRDELAPVDVDTLSRADLVVLQPLRPDEAARAAGTLGLGGAQEWLTRIRQDMVGVVNRRSVRWALLSVTPVERQLVGSPDRSPGR